MTSCWGRRQLERCDVLVKGTLANGKATLLERLHDFLYLLQLFPADR